MATKTLQKMIVETDNEEEKERYALILSRHIYIDEAARTLTQLFMIS
jgi:hypothetical protein